MRRVWTRLLASASLGATSALLLISVAAEMARSQNPIKNRAPRAVRTNETRLAGLLPGKTSARRAHELFGTSSVENRQDHTSTWADCNGYQLVVESDEAGIVDSVRIEYLLPSRKPDGCGLPGPNEVSWKTGRGLRLWSSSSDVVSLYGKPDSVSPSTKDGQQLELWYYAFDWAGPDVPQVMEVVCTVGKDGEPGRVVEITLAASSL